MIVVIGAGVIGLAVARALSQKHEVLVLEKNSKFGEETSSRNSEVIHSGIYYPLLSKKTFFCIDGRERLYRFCQENAIPHSRCGKFLVSVSEEENEYLEKKVAHCKDLGVAFERVPGSFIERKMPELRVKEGIYFPLSGIVDSHSFMQALETKTLQSSGTVLYRHEIVSLQAKGEKWQLQVKGADGTSDIEADFVVNCGGLRAAEISNEALQTTRYEHRFCRGRYFGFSGKHSFKTLIYPVPPKDGLGVHVTLDMAGDCRLGPDVEWVDSISYDCEWETLRPSFAAAAAKYWPSLSPEKLVPGLIGIRPKLFVDGEALPDFLVERRGSFLHCLGIESPGLTAALSIADYVLKLVHFERSS